jgi:tetratricopeptide (TPR) repeat protein
LKRYRLAIRQLSRAIRLDSFGQALEDRGYYYRRHRGHACVSLFRYRRALEDFRFVVEKCTPTADDFSTLGFLHRMHGHYADAVGVFESSLAIDPQNYAANHGLAYILATCSAATFRDGPRAVQIATLLNERSRYGNWSDLSLLAGAYAEVGDFDKAVEFARLSAAHAPPGAERERQNRVRLYERKKPFRSRPWLDRYRYRLQSWWLEKHQGSGHGESSSQ